MGAPHSLDTSVFWRGWYQKSYMNSNPSLPRSQRSAIEKSRGIQHGKTAGNVPVGVAQHRNRDDVAGHAVDGVRCAQAELLLDSSPSITFFSLGARGSEMSRMWIRDERTPGTIIVSRCNCEWHADEHAFQPKW